MKSSHAVAKQLRVPPLPHSLATKGAPRLVRRIRPNSPFADIPLPRIEIFQDPDIVSVLRLTRRITAARFLLLSSPASSKISDAPPPAPWIKTPFASKMLNYVQILTAPTADTLGTSLLLHFDTKRYVFGRIGEGTQRAYGQRKVAINKLDSVFLTGPVDWSNAGGLLGLILTIADIHTTSKEHLKLHNVAKPPKEGNPRFPTSTVPSHLNVHGGKNLSHLLATSRRFVFRQGFPIRPHEIRTDPRSAQDAAATSEPDFQDDNIAVWYMPIEPQSKSSPIASPRKRTHDEFAGHPRAEPSTSGPESNHEVASAVVRQMFDSNWSIDALVETTLHQAKLPAKLFVRDAKGHLQVYSGPMPGSAEEVPDIPVLVRLPWPAATVADLPRTEPSKQSVCYFVRGQDRRGKFNPQEAERLGVNKKDYRFLTNRQSVKGKDGIEVTPEMVLGETVAGTGFAVIDLPDVSYVEDLINRPEWANDRIMKGIMVVFWILGPDVVQDPQLQAFMQKHSSLRHIVTSADTCPNMLALESPATQAYRLRSINPDCFVLPAHSNKESLLGTPVTQSSAYEIGRVGKAVQFAPHYVHQDDKIIPFPDIRKLAEHEMSNEILQMAAQARTKVSDPEFIARVEKAEADIPNRDAEIITLGTGSAVPSKYRNVSGTLVRVPGYGNYLFDAGENTVAQLRRVFGNELPSVLRDLKAIWISHLHADHHLGTVSVIKAWHEETQKSDPSAKLLLASHTHMIEWLREFSDAQDFGFDRLVTCPFHRRDRDSRIAEIREFDSEETKQFGLQKIEGCWVVHCFGALATAFTFPSGLKIAYSGDCRPSDAFVQIGQGATLLIHESTFDDELRGDAKAKKHSTMSEAIDVGRRMGARRILLTHFSQRYQKIPTMEEGFDDPPDVEAGGIDMAKEDEVILVAFDYMRTKLGGFRKAQAFLPTIQKLFEGAEQ